MATTPSSSDIKPRELSFLEIYYQSLQGEEQNYYVEIVNQNDFSLSFTIRATSYCNAVMNVQAFALAERISIMEIKISVLEE